FVLVPGGTELRVRDLDRRRKSRDRSAVKIAGLRPVLHLFCGESEIDERFRHELSVREFCTHLVEQLACVRPRTRLCVTERKLAIRRLALRRIRRDRGKCRTRVCRSP